MSVEERLRAGLGAGPGPSPGLEARLAETIRRGRGRRAWRRAGTALAVAAVATLTVVALPRVVRALDHAEPAAHAPTVPSPWPTMPPTYSRVTGTYRLVVSKDEPGARRLGAAGTWVLTLTPDHRASLARLGQPPTWSTYWSSPQFLKIGVLGGICGAGRRAGYTWGRIDGELRFVNDRRWPDPCALRAFLLHGPGRGHGWKETG